MQAKDTCITAYHAAGYSHTWYMSRRDQVRTDLQGSAWTCGVSKKGRPVRVVGARERKVARCVMAQVRQAEFETCGSITKWSKRRDEAFRRAHWHKQALRPEKQPKAAPLNVYRTAPSDDVKD
jgi:hypothetical protein